MGQRIFSARMKKTMTNETGRQKIYYASHKCNVIPAKAGIHVTWQECSNVDAAARDVSIRKRVWIPAFAGMTGAIVGAVTEFSAP